MSNARWLDLDGTANARDLGGLPVAPGRAASGAGTVRARRVRAGRLLRSDNLQDLSPRDVRWLVDSLHLDTVIDLRTGVEVRGEGPGPLADEPAVAVHHLSLFPELPTLDGPPAVDELRTVDAPPAPAPLPWQDETDERAQLSAGQTYLRYLTDRADSVMAALRLIARARGATVVHCAAGKDRTGVVVALALLAVGVPRSAVIEDYLASADRIDAILARLAASGTYAGDVLLDDPDHHRPVAHTIEQFLDLLDSGFGGAPEWLRRHGWTDDDQAVLTTALVEPTPAAGAQATCNDRLARPIQ